MTWRFESKSRCGSSAMRQSDLDRTVLSPDAHESARRFAIVHRAASTLALDACLTRMQDYNIKYAHRAYDDWTARLQREARNWRRGGQARAARVSQLQCKWLIIRDGCLPRSFAQEVLALTHLGRVFSTPAALALHRDRPAHTSCLSTVAAVWPARFQCASYRRFPCISWLHRTFCFSASWPRTQPTRKSSQRTPSLHSVLLQPEHRRGFPPLHSSGMGHPRRDWSRLISGPV